MCLKRLRIKTKLVDLAKWEFLIILNLTIIEKEQKPVFKGPSVDGTGFQSTGLTSAERDMIVVACPLWASLK